MKLIAGLALVAILAAFTALYIRGQRGDAASRAQAEAAAQTTPAPR